MVEQLEIFASKDDVLSWRVHTYVVRIAVEYATKNAMDQRHLKSKIKMVGKTGIEKDAKNWKLCHE